MNAPTPKEFTVIRITAGPLRGTVLTLYDEIWWSLGGNEGEFLSAYEINHFTYEILSLPI